MRLDGIVTLYAILRYYLFDDIQLLPSRLMECIASFCARKSLAYEWNVILEDNSIGSPIV
jgi:hypothetical protein